MMLLKIYFTFCISISDHFCAAYLLIAAVYGLYHAHRCIAQKNSSHNNGDKRPKHCFVGSAAFVEHTNRVTEYVYGFE